MATTVFVAHPISGDVEGNIIRVLEICRQIHSQGVIPVVPYLAALRYLDYDNPEEVELGVAASLECFHRRYIDQLWLFGDRISSGMRREIVLARKLGIPIVPQTSAMAQELEDLLKA